MDAMDITKFGVDPNEYYQGFIKSTSMGPSEALKELEQNIKCVDNTELLMAVNFKAQDITGGYIDVISTSTCKNNKSKNKKDMLLT